MRGAFSRSCCPQSPMNIAMVVTGHRTNPFDLEGTFTVHFNTADFSTSGPANPVWSRDLKLSVEARAAPIPLLLFLIEREADGVRLEYRLECRRLVRNYTTVTAQ